MVSTLYTAKKFFELQKKREIAMWLKPNKKLLKDTKGFYLLKKRGGKLTKERLTNTSLIYSRGEGVTHYKKSRDKNKITIGLKLSPKKFSNKAHMGDRETPKGRKYKI